MTSVTVLAVDLGSSSGRVIAGTFDGEAITAAEVYRFAHEAKEIDGDLVWDVDEIWANTVTGLRRALEIYPDARSVSVDTWGVDTALLDGEGNLLRAPWAYRDARTARTAEAYQRALDPQRGWELTGNAQAEINTSNQLFALLQEQPELAKRVENVLLLPDYFNYLLTAKMGWSASICSTSALTEPGARAWSTEVLQSLGIPRGWLGEISADLSVVGQCVVEGLEQLKVVRGGAHDTACAFHVIPPGKGDSRYFLSCGSWSLLGQSRPTPLLGESARSAGLTNEVCTDGAIRSLYNLTGLWILQECQRQWEQDGLEADIVKLVEAAEAAGPQGAVIDPDDPIFVAPGNMARRLADYLRDKSALEGLSQGQLVRVILESLAVRYARGIDWLDEITGGRVEVLQLVGGGSHNKLLCQLTADATGLSVEAGPAEASSLGALIAQLETLGECQESQRGAIMAASATTRVYEANSNSLIELDWNRMKQMQENL